VPNVDGVVIAPGEVFSYWRLIGNPTRRKGYQPGMVLHTGGFRPGVGGGLCQLSNLIFWMTAHTPLTVIERHRHGYDVFPDANRTQPFGSGATCSYNYLDLCIRNDTPYIFCLSVSLTETHLQGRWLCDQPLPYTYELYETNHRFQSEYWGGFSRHNELRRKTLNQQGQIVSDDYFIENHAIMMYSPLLPQAQE